VPERRLSRISTVVTAAAIVIALGALYLAYQSGRGSGTPSVPGQVHVSGSPRTSMLGPGDRIPSFSAPALGGGRVDWNTYRGRAVVLALWASWCPHCQSELPVLAEVARDFPNVDLVTITSAVGQQPGPTPAEFMKDHGLSFPVAVDDSDNTLLKALGARYIPTLYFVNSEGKVVRAIDGEVPESTLRTLFEALH
jgi:peroxiredoxin